MGNDNEIVLFGHRIPKKVYEDYEHMEKLKDKISDMLNNSVELNVEEKNQLRSLLSSMSEKFHEMNQRQCPRPPFLTK